MCLLGVVLFFCAFVSVLVCLFTCSLFTRLLAGLCVFVCLSEFVLNVLLFTCIVRSDFVQEVAGKGLALVYQAAGSESKQGLVDSLVEALSTGRRRAAATSGAATGASNAHSTTRAGSALSEAGGGAYGEMCAVANDVGRPDLIYSFLSMASHHAAWSTRR